jgi:hypothetical protein
LKLNGVDDRCRRCDVDDLHERVVKRIICCEKIEIPSNKDYQEEFVRSDRNA